MLEIRFVDYEFVADGTSRRLARFVYVQAIDATEIVDDDVS